MFPEAFVSGYPRGLDFGDRVGSRTSEGREMFRRYWESAVDVPGPATAAMGAIARKVQAYLVIGVIERDGGTLYCSVLFFAPDGSLMGKHRKLMPTAAERLVWGFGDGSTMQVFDSAIGRIGAVNLLGNYMPLLRMHLFAQGVQLYCADGRRPRNVASDRAAHRVEGPVLRPLGESVCATLGLSRSLSGGAGERSEDSHVAWWKLHRRPVGAGGRRAAL